MTSASPTHNFLGMILHEPEPVTDEIRDELYSQFPDMQQERANHNHRKPSWARPEFARSASTGTTKVVPAYFATSGSPPTDKEGRALPSARPIPPSPQTNPIPIGRPQPTPLAIPTPRRRAGTLNGPHRFNSSSPTHTPFAITPTGSSPVTPGGSSFMGAYGSLGGMAAAKMTPPRRAGSSPPDSSPRSRDASLPNGEPNAGIPSPRITNSVAIPGAGSAGAKKDVPSSPPQRKKNGFGTSLKNWFDFDGSAFLGPLDPNRFAELSAPDKVTAVVFHAETEDGLSVCRSLLRARRYKVVALMLDIDTPATKELKEQDVRCLQVDMDNPGSYSPHLRGTQVVYLSSNALALHTILVHQKEPMRTEIARNADRCQLAKAVAACSRSKVGHVVFRVNACGHEVALNSLARAGGMSVLEAPEDLLAAGVPTTILHTVVPYDRVNQWLIQTDQGLKLEVPIPETVKMPMFAMNQTGDYVLAILENPQRWIGKDLYALVETMSALDIAERLSKYSRQPVQVSHMTFEEFNSLESHERLTCRWDAWAQLVNGEFRPRPSQIASKTEVPNMWRFGDWLARDPEIRKKLKVQGR